MWRAIIGTIVVLAALGVIFWSVFTVGQMNGERRLRKQLGVYGQRKIKAHERLVHQGAEILYLMAQPAAGLTVDDITYVCEKHRILINKWLAEYETYKETK